MPSSYITKSGFEKLFSELEYLKLVKRKEIADYLRESNGGNDTDGDISPEFSLAREKQAFVEGRILELESLLSDPDIIDNHLHGDMIEIGSRVTISENNLEPVTYTIVGPIEASPGHGLISFESPLGNALIGRCSGDDVVVNSPGGIYQVHIIEVN